MPFVIFRARSRERSQSLPGQFLSRRCFTLCITMEVEPRIAKQYKCHHSVLQLQKITGEEGGRWRGEKKCLCVASVWLTRRSRISGEKMRFAASFSVARAASYCLLPDTFRLRASKNAFKVVRTKFANSLSPPSVVKKVRTGSKSSQGT